MCEHAARVSRMLLLINLSCTQFMDILSINKLHICRPASDAELPAPGPATLRVGVTCDFDTQHRHRLTNCTFVLVICNMHTAYRLATHPSFPPGNISFSSQPSRVRPMACKLCGMRNAFTFHRKYCIVPPDTLSSSSSSAGSTFPIYIHTYYI